MTDRDLEEELRRRLHEQADQISVEPRLAAVKQEVEVLAGDADGRPVPAIDPFAPRERDARPGVGARVAVLASLVVFAAAIGGVALYALDGGPAGNGGGVVELDVAGPYDGLESIGLPITVEPDVGLVDLQEVVVSGSGFSPGIQLGVVQCWLAFDGTGSIDDCDIANYHLASVDEQGAFTVGMPVRRFIATSNGRHDCALGGVEQSCAIAAGNLQNYDESGTVRTFFDPEVEGVRPPVLAVEPRRGLADGTEVLVTGSDFEPGEPVRLTQCVLNTSGIDGCFSANPTGEVVADPDGGFAVFVRADRFVDGPAGAADCLDDPYGCRLVAAAKRIPSPVELFYEGAQRPPPGPDYRISPSRDLVDGAVVHVEIREFGGVDGAPYVARQCVDRRVPEVICGPDLEGVVTDGAIVFDLSVTRTLTAPDGSITDCAQNLRTCYVTVETADYVQDRLPLGFVAEVTDE